MNTLISVKVLYISYIISFILTINSVTLFGQVFDSGQNPPHLKWLQINTPNFQILYPAGFETEAQRTANTLQHLIKSVSKTLGATPKKITIILQNQGVVSNGFVQLAPRRSELFTAPPQNFDVQDWINSLAVHELRHVVQFDKLTGKLKAPLFEELALAIFGVSLPPWFFEGDAVGIETALSKSGRGRLPDWELIFRTNTLSGRKYSYSKNYFGSFRDLTPGYYQLGYFMTNKLRRDYGKGIMDSIMTRISRNPVRPYNLSNSVKKFTGLNTKELHDSTIRELHDLWSVQDIQLKAREYPTLNKRPDKTPSDYLLPVRISSDEIIALKKGLSNTPVFIRIDSAGNEKKLLKIGYQTESNFSYSADKLVWDEVRYDKRFQKRSFNVINIYDLQTGYYRQLSSKSRLFSPALSSDGKAIVAVRVKLNNDIELVELDANTGTEIRTFGNPANYILQTPSYNKEGTKIIAVAVNQDGAALLEFDRRTGSANIILPFQRQQIVRPVYAGDRIIFRAHYDGVNNLYLLEPDHLVSELTNARYSATNPSYFEAGRSILFNNFQATGYDIGSIRLEQPSRPVADIEDTFIDYSAPIVKQEASSGILESVPRLKYETQPYKELDNLFYFHSLSPVAEENDLNGDLNLGFKLKSNNKLNTLDFYTGYQYNIGLKRSEYLAGFTYKRFYPLFDVKYINRARLSYTSKTVGNLTTLIPVTWREDFAEFEVRLPFFSNRLNKNLNMELSGSTNYTSRYNVNNRPLRFTDNIRFPLKYQFDINHNTQRSLRDLAPLWGQNLSLSYESLSLENDLSGDIFRLQTWFYTPGFAPNHTFQTSFNYQETSGAYRFNVDIPRISGYTHMETGKVRNTLLLDYRFPIFYPDTEIGPVAYIKRLRGSVFSDFQNLGKGNPFRPITYGVELNADMNLLRFYLPDIALGLKLIFVNERPFRTPFAEFSFNYGF